MMLTTTATNAAWACFFAILCAATVKGACDTQLHNHVTVKSRYNESTYFERETLSMI